MTASGVAAGAEPSTDGGGYVASRNYQQQAAERWPDRALVPPGAGPTAVLGCHHTVTLWADADNALMAKRYYDRHGCGSPDCTGRHTVRDLTGGVHHP